MNILSNLQSNGQKKKRRLGRGTGSGAGAKSGRGTTRHQTARQSIPLHFEGGQGKMVKRFPLLRGKGRNKPASSKPVLIQLSQLAELKTENLIDSAYLVEKNLISEKDARRGVKIVADVKEIASKLTVSLPISKTSRLIIEKAGGKVK